MKNIKTKPSLLTLSLFILSVILTASIGASTALAACGGTTNVATEAELNAAITDFNSQSGPCSYTIVLTADINLTASTTTIDNSVADVDLLIEGGGFTVDGQDISGVRLFRIAADTMVTIDNITLTRASAGGFGGGISNAGNLTLANSAVINNTAHDGGGIYNDFPGVAVVLNSTLSGNSGETGGGINNGGNLTLIHTTMSGNGGPGRGAGGAIAQFGQLQVQNSIFANSVNEDNCFDFGASSSLGYNLTDDTSCEFLGATTDIINVDPLLGPLADNGGDTETHALQSGSPAIDHIPAGVNGCGTTITSDQRGVARPRGTGCDIGAFEVEMFNFNGFFSPIDNLPTVNQVKAGQTIPVKFSLNGDQGLDIFAEGYPLSQEVACDGSAPVNEVEETDTPGNSGLSYDPDTDQYSYTWKTDKGWSGACRQLIVQFNDGSEYTALFQFK